MGIDIMSLGQHAWHMQDAPLLHDSPLLHAIKLWTQDSCSIGQKNFRKFSFIE